MRLRGNLFWGIVLIFLAVLLLSSQQGWIKGDIFGYFWPVLVILFGIWLLTGALSRGRSKSAGQSLSIPLESARSARIKLDHGAGRLNIQGGASSTELLNGVFGAEVENSTRFENDQLQVRLRNSPHFWAWYPGAKPGLGYPSQRRYSTELENRQRSQLLDPRPDRPESG